jgi:hypothetical protein
MLFYIFSFIFLFFSIIYIVLKKRTKETYTDFNDCRNQAAEFKKCKQNNEDCFIDDHDVLYKGSCKIVDTSHTLKCVAKTAVNCNEEFHCQKCRIFSNGKPLVGQCMYYDEKYTCMTPDEINEKHGEEDQLSILSTLKIDEFKHILKPYNEVKEKIEKEMKEKEKQKEKIEKEKEIKEKEKEKEKEKQKEMKEKIKEREYIQHDETNPQHILQPHKIEATHQNNQHLRTNILQPHKIEATHQNNQHEYQKPKKKFKK